ncbi:Appr-1-p processing protein [Pyrodictium occultum]|uniref:Appr-1-p processing protein n=1 Tax=Pyrodictium occultum TaxID=2309 RepID=A0A0V8RUT9_PYROC|nr:macro domain-containing protein [Pyrodictium occultum]KSW11808.1 Appr-1-p processing protein [Pyrodictium occultum]
MAPGVKFVKEIGCGDRKIIVAKGDITEIECDAVVNPANSLMYMGGGVAGALKRAAGPEVEEEAKRYAPVPVGKAVATGAGRLEPRIRMIIHAPTMERPAMRTTVSKVVRATRAALDTAKEKGASCVAFPAMGAGVGGLEARESMEAMLEALDEHWKKSSNPQTVVFVAYMDRDLRQFLEVLERARLESCRREGAKTRS